MSPADSAIASGATSGVTTKAPSVVAEGDLEKFEDEDQFQPPSSTGGYGYQSFPDQQQPGRNSRVPITLLIIKCHKHYYITSSVVMESSCRGHCGYVMQFMLPTSYY